MCVFITKKRLIIIIILLLSLYIHSIVETMQRLGMYLCAEKEGNISWSTEKVCSHEGCTTVEFLFTRKNLIHYYHTQTL